MTQELSRALSVGNKPSTRVCAAGGVCVARRVCACAGVGRAGAGVRTAVDCGCSASIVWRSQRKKRVCNDRKFVPRYCSYSTSRFAKFAQCGDQFVKLVSR